MRRAAVREGVIIGAVAASRPRPVVVAAPVAYGATAVYPPAVYPPEVYPPAVYPPPQTEVIMAAPGAPMPGYPPTAGVYVDPMVRPVGPAVVEVGRPLPAPGAMAAGAVAAVAVAERQHFMIINEATCTVLSVEKCCIKPGTYLVLDQRHPSRSFHQIWYMDREGIIRSKLTDFAPEGKRIDERMHMMPYVGDVRQQWVIEGHRIVNRLARAECLGLRKHLRLKNDADVIVSAYEGKPWQHWRIEPIIL